MARRNLQIVLAAGIGLTAIVMTLVLLGLCAAAPPTLAAGCSVPGDKATIQAAINDPACNPIFVAAGTYVENLTINRSLTLQGADRNTTIIDGNHSDAVIKITNGAVPTIQGFTIRNGNGNPNSGQGGGICVDRAAAVIQDNIIADNAASTISNTNGLGGGISVVTSTGQVLIYSNVIRNNVAFSSTRFSTDTVRGEGGGLYLMNTNSVVVSGNQIVANAAGLVPGSEGGGRGGGISASGDHLILHDNIIQGNYGAAIQGPGVGGGIFLWRPDAVTITHNAILENTGTVSGAAAYGGGMWSGGFQRLRMVSNDIMSNTGAVEVNRTDSGGLLGGGIVLDDLWGNNETVLLEDNRIIGNVTAQTVIALGAGLNGGASGGGLSVTKMANTTFISNEIASNVCVRSLSLLGGATGSSSGGGIRIYENEYGLVFLQGNTIRDNTANLELGVTANDTGGGLSVSQGMVDSRRNLYLNNRMNALYQGTVGGIWAWESVVTSTNDVFAHNLDAIGGGYVSLVLVNDTLYDNHRRGASIGNGSSMLVSNTIVYSHSSGLQVSTQGAASTLIESYNLLSNTTNYDGVVTKRGHTLLDRDALFADVAADDLRLLAGSPAINVANDAWAPPIDFDGVTRPQGDSVDIGAFERRYNQCYLPVTLKNE